MLTAVIVIEPSASAPLSGTVKLQLPSESVVVVPSDLSSAKSSTVLPASAVPVKLGVLSLVKLPDLVLMNGVLNVISSCLHTYRKQLLVQVFYVNALSWLPTVIAI